MNSEKIKKTTVPVPAENSVLTPSLNEKTALQNSHTEPVSRTDGSGYILTVNAERTPSELRENAKINHNIITPQRTVAIDRVLAVNF